MTDTPAMLLWTDAYLGDTGHLSTLEHGAYLVILMAMWRNGGSLPNDERRLARTAGLPLDKWRKIAPAILSFMTINGATITQKRLMLEFKIQSCRTEKSRAAGNASARAKALKKLNPTPTVVASELELGGNLTRTRTRTRKEENINSVDSSETLPASASPEAGERPPKIALKKRAAYPPDFETFWKAYPTDRNMSKAEAFAQWKRLDADDRDAAIRSCPSFRAYCAANAKTGYRPVYAERYLKKRQFEGHAEGAEKTSSTVFVRVGSPQWQAWTSYYADTKGKSPPINKEGTGWWFQSDNPPSVGRNP